jgi:DNA-binding response OmpR family regulator
MRVLVADDDPVITQVIRTGLRAKGWEVEVAADAMQAVMFAMRSPPDALVLDLNMPGGTGITALKRLKASVKTQFIPVLVLSGTADENAPTAVLSVGADGFLPKPVDVDELHRALRRLLHLPVQET